MAESIREAFCLLYFKHNGGQLRDNDIPVFNSGNPVRSNCDRPWDCGTCTLLHSWVKQMQELGWSVGWECRTCIGTDLKHDPVVETILPGYYQSAWPDDRDNPPIQGCTACRQNETSFLQLVLRRLKRCSKPTRKKQNRI